MRRVGIINSGGDCSGLNAVIASVVKAGIPLGFEFIGFERGWEGLLSPMKYRTLDLAAVRGISYLGGTILGTVNKGRFGAKLGEGGKRAIPMEILEEAKYNLGSVGTEGLIVIGGDGTLSGALQLAELGVHVVGVPKTIDNDLMCTDRTFGFSTAAQVVVDALDRIHTTASSHGRVIFVETMGRNTGWIALRAGLAGGADAILLPEFPFELENLVAFLRERQARGRATVVVVAEGVKIGGRRITDDIVAGNEAHLGGVSTFLMRTIEKLAPEEFEMRTTILGHVQRGGTPNSADRTLAKGYGVEAIKAYQRGEFGKMVVYTNLGMSTVPIGDGVGQIKEVSSETMEYVTANDLGVFMQ